MANFMTAYFENNDRFYDDFEKEGMNLNDLQLKNKFNFKAGKHTFSSKSRFDVGTKSKVSHELGFKTKCSGGFVDIKAKNNGEVSLDTDNQCIVKDDVILRSYSKFVFEQNEAKKNLNADVMMRVHHKDNALFSFGCEKWNVCAGAPTTASVYGSYGHNVEGTRFTGNMYVNYDIKNKFVPLAKFFVRAQKDKLHGFIQANINSTQNTVEDTEKPKTVTSQKYDLVARVFNQVNDTCKAGLTLKYNVDAKKADVVLSGSHVADRVKFNGKIESDKSVTVGVTSVMDDVTVAFAARSALMTVTEKVEDKDVNKYHANFNFGLTAEFNRL